MSTPTLIRNEGELLAAIRARCLELQITYDTLDQICMLPDRYASKLLCEHPTKHMGAMTMWTVLQTLGFEISLATVEVPAHLRERMTPREQAPQAHGKRRFDQTITFDFMRKIGRKGGKVSGAVRKLKLRRSKINRRNALKRWDKPKISEG